MSTPITDEEVQAKGWEFNYSPEEWSIIQELVEGNCDLPFLYEHLLRIANLYLHQLYSANSSPGSQAQPWTKFADDAEAIYQMAGSVIEQLEELDRDEGDKFRRALALKEDVDKLRHILAQATALRDALDSWASGARISTSKREIRRAYYRNVLYCWWASGGALRRSRSSPDSEVRVVGGPTVDYFDAAVRPVLGHATPSPERIYQLIKETRDEIPEGRDQMWRELLLKHDPNELWDKLLSSNDRTKAHAVVIFFRFLANNFFVSIFNELFFNHLTPENYRLDVNR